MSFKPVKATPVDERLLIGIAGPQNSGKTVSALRLATGIAGPKGKIVLIDTENKRARKYAGRFNFDTIDLDPPFDSLRYLEAIQAADDYGADVIIVDSTSHEHEGPGGVLEQHEQALQKMAGDDYRKREKLKFAAWIKPKANRNRLIQFGLQRTRAHVILCFRAKEKLEMVKVDGKIEPVNTGWQPISGDEFGYEMSIMMILPPGSKGTPDWEQKGHRINDMEGKLTNLLTGWGQITEELGEKVRDLCRVTPLPAATAQQQSEYYVLLDGDKRLDFAGIPEWVAWMKSSLPKIATPEQAQNFLKRNSHFGNYRPRNPDIADILDAWENKTKEKL